VLRNALAQHARVALVLIAIPIFRFAGPKVLSLSALSPCIGAALYLRNWRTH
jgi:hypothetical protein